MLKAIRLRKTARDWAVAALALSAFAIAGLALARHWRGHVYRLTLTAGSPLELRHRLAETIATEGAGHGLAIRVIPSAGSEEAYDRVNAGTLDLALAVGGLGHADHPDVRQVAALHIEPMHLLVKEEIFEEVSDNLGALKGKVVNISKGGSGTHWLALDTLRFAGLVPVDPSGQGDYIASTLDGQQLEGEADRDKLPDAVFLVTTMPSRVAKYLVTKHRYRLVSLPFGEAFSLDALAPDDLGRRPLSGTDIVKTHVHDTVIPAFTYEVEPDGVPPKALHTLGTRLLLVAHKDVDPWAIARLLEAIFGSRLAMLAKPPLGPDLLELPPELPLHPGTKDYLRRTKPLITGDLMDFLDKATSIGGPILGGSLFLWQWTRRRNRRLRDEGFEHYISKVTAVERQALQYEMTATLQLRELLGLQQELGQLKAEALAKFVDGELEGEQLMSGFLTHVNDARDYLARLILHVRDNLEEEAHLQGRSLKSLWHEAIQGAKDAPDDGQGPPSKPDHKNFQSPLQST